MSQPYHKIVYLTLRNGMIDWYQLSKGVKLVIHDYDVSDDWSAAEFKRDSNGNPYQEIILLPDEEYR